MTQKQKNPSLEEACEGILSLLQKGERDQEIVTTPWWAFYRRNKKLGVSYP